jgi:mannitol/fructose-specific phosphotransferase system IIA component (Ntr-type)
MTLADFTRPGLIIPHLVSRDETSAIHELSLTLQREGCVPDWLRFYHEALNREYLLSTDMEAGMAFPHARLPGLRELIFAFGRSDVPFAWGPGVTHPVRMVFLLAVPSAGAEPYLPLISALARLSGNNALLDAIRSAVDSDGIVAVFRQIALSGSATPVTLAPTALTRRFADTGERQ